jgi:tetratricopeptide (TPR) repeat protein
MKPKFSIPFTILSLIIPGILFSGCSSYERKNEEKWVSRINDTLLPVQQRFMLLAELGQKALQHPNNTMLRRDYARLLLAAGFSSSGLKIYREELVKYPDDKELRARIVNVEIASMMLPRDTQAGLLTTDQVIFIRELDSIRTLNEIIATHTSEPGLYVRRGNHFLVIDQKSAGTWDIKKSLTLDPCFADALFSSAVMEMREGNNMASLNNMHQLKDCIHRNDLMPKQSWADFSAFLHSIIETDSLIRKNPDRPDDYLNKAIIYMRGKEYDLALAALDDGLLKSPDNARIYAFRALINHAAGNQEEALFDLEKAERLGGRIDSELSKQIRGNQ